MTITREIPGARIRRALAAVDRGESVAPEIARILIRAGFVDYGWLQPHEFCPCAECRETGAYRGDSAPLRLTTAGARVVNGAPADPTAEAVARYAERLADHDAPELAPYARRLIEAELRGL